MSLYRARFVVLAAVLWASACTTGSSGAAASETKPSPAPKTPAGQTLPVDPVYDEIASFLAGRPCGFSPYKEFQESTEYRAFMAALDQSWSEMEARRLGPMRLWAEREIAESRAATTSVFYPFGGPDALTPLILFPEAAHYLLLGLEFPGRMPEFPTAMAENMSGYIAGLQAALGDFFKKSYFITKNMNEALADEKVDGVLPLLCFFLKRSGFRISSIKRLEFAETGEAVETPFPGEKQKRRRPFGIRVTFFQEGTDTPREMSYISCDLENKAYQEGKPLDTYLRNFPFETTFIKSASYLMHYREFSNIRGLILARSRFILQDDTGIPYRHFPPEAWDVRLFGTFAPPVADFKGVDQPDLRAAFEQPGRARPLPFPMGYHWGTKKDALIYLVKK